MAKILKREKNGCVCIFPCGMSTASGAQQPSANGSGKMLKHFGVTVLRVLIHGGYFVSPKFDVKERYGKVEVELDELFTPQQLRNSRSRKFNCNWTKRFSPTTTSGTKLVSTVTNATGGTPTIWNS